MTALVQGELLKLRTTRTALGFGIAALVLVLLLVVLTTTLGDPDTLEAKRGVIDVGTTLYLPLLIFGIVVATGEYRHRTLAPALLVAPDRGRLALARMLACGLAGLAVCAALLVVVLAIGLPLLAGQPGEDLGAGDIARAVVSAVVTGSLAAMIGVGIGVLVRNQVAAVVGALLYVLVVEPLLGLVSWLAPYTISGAVSGIGTGGDGLLDPVPATAVLAAWALAFVVAGVLVDRARDVT